MSTDNTSFRRELQLLLTYGFYVGLRNPDVLPKTPGVFMIVDDHEMFTKEYQESTGEHYVVIGNDLEFMVRDAARYVLGFFSNSEKALENICAGKTGILSVDDPQEDDSP